MAEFSVSAGLARGLIEIAVARGADQGALLARAGIGAADLGDQDNRIPFDRYVALMRAAKALSGDPALALHYGDTVDMSEFSIVGLIFPACETLRDAIVQVNRYGRLITQVDVGAPDRFQWVQRDGRLWLVDARRDPNAFPELTEATFARFIGMTRRVGFDGIVTAVHVTHEAPAHGADYERVFGAPTSFGSDWNAMQVEAEALARPIARQSRYAFGVLSAHGEALLASLDAGATMRRRVESLLMTILHTGEAGMAPVAARLGMSRQTLFRKLRAEGTSFERLLDELRHKLALHYLAGRKASVNETAYLVGFSDPAAFSRAFKRWTGTSPREARASVIP